MGKICQVKDSCSRSLLFAGLVLAFLGSVAKAQILFSTGFDYNTEVATATISTSGFSFTPSIQNPSGTGTPPTSGSVLLKHVDVLFVNGSGVKNNVNTPNRNLAIFPSLLQRTGAAVFTDAMAGEVIDWNAATVLGTGATGSSTWIRYAFNGASVFLDVNTKYYAAFINPSTGIAFGTNTADKTSLGADPNINSGGGYIVTSSQTESGTYDIIFSAAFSIPEPSSSGLLAGALGIFSVFRSRRKATGK